MRERPQTVPRQLRVKDEPRVRIEARRDGSPVCLDGHDGTPAQADAWLRSWVPVLMSGPDWRSGRLAIVVVFDEGETTEQVPFVLMAPGLSGVKITEPANQYALTRLIDKIIGAPPLRQASSAANVAYILGAVR